MDAYLEFLVPLFFFIQVWMGFSTSLSKLYQFLIDELQNLGVVDAF